MVEWLAGNRIRGTSAEKPALALPSGSVGGWKELARTTLGSAGADIDVTGFADKRYYMVLCSDIPTGRTQWQSWLGDGDFTTGQSSAYSTRENYNGGSDSTIINYSEGVRWNASVTTAYTNPKFGVGYIANLSSKEKLTMFHGVAQQTAGAGYIPDRGENVGKWTYTSGSVDSFRLHDIETVV